MKSVHKRNSYQKSDYGLKSENSDLQNRQTINYIKYTNYLITGLATVYFAYALVTGDQLVLPWETEATFKIRPLLLEYFELNGRPSGLSVDQVIGWQKFKTRDLHYPGQVQNLLILAVLLALISVTTVVSYLERFRYFVVSGVVVFVLAQLRLEELGVWVPYLNYGVILGYAVLTYLFHSFWKAPLHTRFILTLLY